MQADIIITNHALLCTDMFHQYQYLPSYDKVIIDEAHHFEETASKRYGLKLDYVHMLYALNQIGSSTSDSWLGQVLYDYAEMTDTALLQRWDDHFEKAKHEIDDLFRLLFQYVLEKNKYDQSLSDIGRIQYRLQAADETETKWKRIKEMVNRLSTLLHELCNDLVSLQQIDLDGQTETQLQNHKSILESFYDNLQELFLKTDDTSVVKWVEIEAKGAKNAVYMYSEPIDMSQLLSKEFFEVKHSVILTSATLTMNNSFSFMKKRLGIPENRLESKMIPSPFSYKDQVQLLIPNDFPDIRYGNQDAFIEASTEAILSLAEITSGRMLVLFTSYDMLKKAYYLLRDAIVDQAYMLIAQGITSGSRSRLKKNFQSFDKAILLGTSSFWEGVDIPGEDLSCLVIVRLPFEAPGHPLFEAKSEKLKQEGKNAFFDLSLPNAVIRFKQGFGRLIRTQHDRGIVFVCDARIMKSRYGTFFTKSIPEVSTYYDTTTKVLEKARQWF
ncbi:helicase C-terminal domain-containing protein [Virgibacillus sp. 179-BFC.A HS]|uniref:Helicase C-terminal domain-containing protein n=1 Tax=Tigheibacillus jepli TaxID=3035914 RepID=A0ABU5CH94_9BACI|nr:helicase C-terminal domain-containing protein [Virgibacillus sp. 179-BFC.A HS]MDY0405722.1 helicase C-terminal domain-containing protein [Virgibacillus sp. 179-BFC.A HS]